MFLILVSIFEFLISIVCIIFSITALSYFGLTFIEERIHTIKKFLIITSWSVIGMSILMPFANLPSAFFFLTLTSHGIILFLLYTCYPFVYIFRPDFIVMIILTFINNTIFVIFCFTEMNFSLFQVLAYFVIYIWGTPMLFILSLAVTEDATEERRSRRVHSSFWAPIFQKMIKWAKSKVPSKNDRFD